ncbi:MAG TPA: GNAT family N-acetyltransferase [Stellaceae bacterium]|nr:GNAT family N-acetyltransferase [Stellaceae bacterium]
MITIREAQWPQDRDAVARLMRAYADSLDIDLGFQGFEAELAGLPGSYARPRGVVLIAWPPDEPAGIVAYRPQDAAVCEMKRLYVRPCFRGTGLGRHLCEALIEEARLHGYRRMVLDTLASMAAARRLYAALGFRATAPYYDNPLPGTAYLALDL